MTATRLLPEPKTVPGQTCAILEPNALTVIIKSKGEKKEKDLPIAAFEAHASEGRKPTYFQPASLNLRAYIFPISPIPMMPMLLPSSIVMSVILQRGVRGLHSEHDGREGRKRMREADPE